MLKRFIDWITNTQIWLSVMRHGYPDTERDQSLVITSNVLMHLHPVKVRKHAVKFSYTLGLGGLSFLLFLILSATGVMLMFWYIPSTEKAYGNIKDLEFVVSFGPLLRNMHRWSAHAMVAVVFLHMCRVFYTGSYKAPREFNWVLGVILFSMTLVLSYTGYLLPWDQLAFWGVTVGTNMAKAVPVVGEYMRYLMLGGNIVGQSALLRFYVLHCVFLPIVAGGLMAMHFWRIRKDGGISGPPYEGEGETATIRDKSVDIFPTNPAKTYGLMSLVDGTARVADKEPEDTVMTWPNLVFKELILAIIVINVLLLASFFFNAPLEEMANPTKTPNPAKAPWYFLGLQELVSDTSIPYGGKDANTGAARKINGALVGGVIVPSLIILGLMAIPYIDRNDKGTGRWFARERKLAITLFTLFVIVMVVLIFIGTFCRGPGWGWYWPWQEWPNH